MYLDELESVDQIAYGDVISIYESKSMPVEPQMRLRPRFGHILAIVLLGVGFFFVPRVVLGMLLTLVGISMALTFVVFVVQVPMRFFVEHFNRQGRKTIEDPAPLN